jgi:putative ABC transport system substrate-binding protein
MRRREFNTLLGGAAATWPNVVAAELLARRALVAMLVSGSSDGYASNVQAFRRGMQQLGYVEGRDVEIVYRYADGNCDFC